MTQRCCSRRELRGPARALPRGKAAEGTVSTPHGDRRQNSAYRFIQLLPDADGLVVRAGDHELSVVAYGERPDLAMMALQLLNVYKLPSRTVSFPQPCSEEHNTMTRLVSIPVLD